MPHHSRNRRSVNEKSAAIINEYEKTTEEKIVNDLLDSVGGKKWMAVAGIDSVLENFYLHKIKMLVVGVSYKKSGFICRHCHRIFLINEACLLCGGKTIKANNLIDEIKEEAIKNKIEIKQLFHSHKKFDRFGIGAFLKGY
jgi:peptide subunit release factor 1 (eRF1)